MPPSMALAGKRTLSRITSAVAAPCWPILRSGVPIDRPGLSAGTRKAVRCALRGSFSGAVRAITVISPAWGALLMKRLVPLST